jgi:hypothetical protein
MSASFAEWIGCSDGGAVVSLSVVIVAAQEIPSCSCFVSGADEAAAKAIEGMLK